jgi:hypothetical protein
MNITEYLNALTKDKTELSFNDDEVAHDYNNFIINRFISMIDIFIPVVNEINQYDLPKETHFRYYQSILPKRKLFFKYIKKKKDLTDTDKRYIATYFEVGLKEAEDYIRLMDEEQVQQILNKYKYGRNKMAQI